MITNDAGRAGRADPGKPGIDQPAPEKEQSDLGERLSQLRAEGAEVRTRLASMIAEVIAAQEATSKTLEESADLLAVIQDWERRREADVRYRQGQDRRG